MSIIKLDSAMGTRLIEMGHKLEAPTWSAMVLEDDVEAVEQVHRENIEAGADVITTNTFRTTPFTFHNLMNGVEAHTRARRFTILAIRIAQKVIKESGRDVKIAASITTLGDCYTPSEFPGTIAGRPWHDAQLDNLAHKVVDIILAETINSSREARLIADLALKREKPVWMSFVLNDQGQLLNGDNLLDLAKRLEHLGIDAIGVNCSKPDVTLEAIKRLRDTVKLPLIAYPNLGAVDHGDGKMGKVMTPAKFAQWAGEVIEAGAEIVGGCCGSNHKHIAALTKLLTGNSAVAK
ncbi:MAG: homocysteine S-methyltransferase family protein [Candidatus Marinimicrobia bacterium]|nr:homocysteine S-methyltransferase family protein [Candidatus Neomarinimicrobiota bacterium]MCF7840561.1 homocysteine S-methyltransferase family protein [Candidatus Neomarinimicrobiota bacterium]MCF7902339.1 homocysteine S-methyltransferase family protein [Candidatus Neomarinimicrobiota bacterium]